MKVYIAISVHLHLDRMFILQFHKSRVEGLKVKALVDQVAVVQT